MQSEPTWPGWVGTCWQDRSGCEDRDAAICWEKGWGWGHCADTRLDWEPAEPRLWKVLCSPARTLIHCPSRAEAAVCPCLCLPFCACPAPPSTYRALMPPPGRTHRIPRTSGPRLRLAQLSPTGPSPRLLRDTCHPHLTVSRPSPAQQDPNTYSLPPQPNLQGSHR